MNVVSRRVKQLRRGSRPLVESLEKLAPEDVALREIIEGRISYELGPIARSKRPVEFAVGGGTISPAGFQQRSSCHAGLMVPPPWDSPRHPTRNTSARNSFVPSAPAGISALPASVAAFTRKLSSWPGSSGSIGP